MIDLIFTAPTGMGLKPLLVAPTVLAGGFNRVVVIASVLSVSARWVDDIAEISKKEVPIVSFNRFCHSGLPFSDLTENDLILVDEMQPWQLEKILPYLLVSSARVWLVNPDHKLVTFPVRVISLNRLPRKITITIPVVMPTPEEHTMEEATKIICSALAEPFPTRPTIPLETLIHFNDGLRDLGLPPCSITLGRPSRQSTPVLVTLASGGRVVAQYDFQYNYWLSSVPGTDPIPTNHILEWAHLSDRMKGVKPVREA